MQFHNALTGTITIGDVGISPEPGYAKPTTRRGKGRRTITRPRMIPVAPGVLDNLAVLDPDQHEEINLDNIVLIAAEVATGPVPGTVEVKPAILAPARIKAETEAGQLAALLARVKPDAITRQEFFAALPARLRRTTDQFTLLTLYNEAAA